MRIYNSLSKDTEEFVPLDDKKVIMYICGLTPYDHAHIGHTRTYIAFDIFKRYLMKKEYSIYHIQNITDVEDKIINRCKKTGADPIELTEKFHKEALELFDKLRILRADVYPKVTEHIQDIINIIEKLIENEYAYETETGVYFNVLKFNSYGKLSGQKTKEMESGTRIDVDKTKKSPLDFALWKKEEGELLEFDSPWGKGRPGWHIECSAMSLKYAKRDTLDVHGGARDLIFPHHENEIAQSEGETRNQFSKYWMHTGFLTVDGEKMSKSLGNFVTLGDAMEKFDSNSIRLFFSQTHYRSPVDYNEEKIKSAGEAVEHIFNSLDNIKSSLKENKEDIVDENFRDEIKKVKNSFYEAMDNDLNTPDALAALFKLVKMANTHSGNDKIDSAGLKELDKKIREMLWIIGLEKMELDLDSKKSEVEKLIEEFGGKKETTEEMLEQLIELREKARKEKDFKTSDSIRDKLGKIGIKLEDNKETARWKLVE